MNCHLSRGERSLSLRGWSRGGLPPAGRSPVHLYTQPGLWKAILREVLDVAVFCSDWDAAACLHHQWNWWLELLTSLWKKTVETMLPVTQHARRQGLSLILEAPKREGHVKNKSMWAWTQGPTERSSRRRSMIYQLLHQTSSKSDQLQLVSSAKISQLITLITYW